VAMWVIAHQAPDPNVSQVLQVRQQVLRVMAGNGTLQASDADKQRLAQAMMYETLIGLNAFNNPAVNRRELAIATQRNLKRRGIDLSALVLTNTGFVAR
jgi:hypothetical protein